MIRIGFLKKEEYEQIQEVYPFEYRNNSATPGVDFSGNSGRGDLQDR